LSVGFIPSPTITRIKSNGKAFINLPKAENDDIDVLKHQFITGVPRSLGPETRF